jgi:ABC-2 type transport system permease protein
MNKYWQLLKLSFDLYTTYRFNFTLWRIRQFAFFASLIFFWQALFGNTTSVLGYNQSQMLTYVVGLAFLRSIILATRTSDIAGEIKDGTLSRFLLKPIGFYQYWASLDIIDKIFNLAFSIVEITIIVLLFRFSFYIPIEPITYLYFSIIVILATVLHFFMSIILSFFAFWTEDIWAARWLFGIIFLEFFSGAFFPIDMLPQTVQNIIYVTPFPYLLFFPAKIWLEQLSMLQIIQAITVCGLWTGVFWYWANYIWRKGSKNYGAYGG